MANPLNNTRFDLPTDMDSKPEDFVSFQEEKIKKTIFSNFNDNPFRWPIILTLLISISVISIFLAGYTFAPNNIKIGNPFLVKKEKVAINAEDLKPKTVIYEQEDREKLLTLVNQYRKEKGLSSVSFNEELNRSAQTHAEDMFNRYYFSHTDPEGRSPYYRLNNTDYAKVGENIIQGNIINVLNPENALKEWIKSPPHNETLLGGDWTLTGIGVKQGMRVNPKTNKEEPVIIWVQLFASVR